MPGVNLLSSPTDPFTAAPVPSYTPNVTVVPSGHTPSAHSLETVSPVVANVFVNAAVLASVFSIVAVSPDLLVSVQLSPSTSVSLTS